MLESVPHNLVASLAAGLAVGVFAYIGVELFRRGWAGYEERYVSGASATLDSMYLTMPRQHLLYLAVLSAVLVGGVALLLTAQPVLAAPISLAGLGVPMLVLSILKKQRDAQFNLQLVDALMSVSNSLKAGMTLPQAFDVLSREMPNPMRQEMRLLCQELRLGLELDEALTHLYQRMPSKDMDLVVTAIAITRDVGGNLTEVFDNIAHTIRERYRIEGKIRALTSQGKMQAFVICLLPFVLAIGMHFVSPGSMAVLFNTWQGALVILVALVVEAAGILVIRRIIRIDI
ncbi:MAG: type II secretion system F family protein [Planctomycetota bacterium]